MTGVKKKHKKQHGLCKWRDSFYVKSYKLAKSGLTNKKIAKALGLNYRTYKTWVDTKPALRIALRDARNSDSPTANKNKMATEKVNGFLNYVYQRLPENLRKLWDKIEAFENEPNAMMMVENLLKDNGESARQHLFIHALVSRNFNISAACRAVNISYTQLRGWIAKDPEFHQLIDQIHIHKKDFFEEALIKLVRRGDSSAVLFVNRTMNRDRGYNEKQEIEVRKSVTHEHLIKISDLGLPLETLKLILEHVRKKREEAPALGFNGAGANGNGKIVEGQFEVKTQSEPRKVHPLDEEDK